MAFLDFIPIIGGALQSAWDATVGQNQSKKLMRYQYELNQKAIDQQNRYNSPIAQMERLRQAGLNPNLVYGNGVDGNQSSAASVGIANRQARSDFGFADVVNNVFRRKQLENETNVANANVESIQAGTLLSKARYLDVMEDVVRKDRTLETFVAKAKADLAHTEQSIAESKQRVNESTQRVSNMQSTANLLQEEIKYWQAHAENERDYVPRLLKARAYQAEQAGDLSKSQQKLNDSLVRLNDKKVEELVSFIRGIDIDNGSKAIEYQLAEKMNELGLTGMKPKDFFNYILMLLKQAGK